MLFLSLLLALLTESIHGHRPLFKHAKGSCGDDFSNSSLAAALPAPHLSWAFLHYFDCTSRVVWTSTATPPSPKYYYHQSSKQTPFFTTVAGLIPKLERFAHVRLSAVVIGPGLPALNGTEAWDALPEEVQHDSIWNGDDIGGVFVTSEAGTNCNYYGAHVIDGRCQLTHPRFGSEMWVVLNEPYVNLPKYGVTYHTAFFPTEDVTAKAFLVTGTHLEDYVTPYPLDTPNCERDLVSDFHETKEGDNSECFPSLQCSTVNDTTTVGCLDDGSEGPSCPAGEVCDNCTISNETLAKVESIHSHMGTCGGYHCLAAVHAWHDINMKMHVGMMDLNLTGNVAIDFVRSMLPHHMGAIDMCNVLLDDLECVAEDDPLDGIVEFCDHLIQEQQQEIDGMQHWLEEQGLDETAPCQDDMPHNMTHRSLRMSPQLAIATYSSSSSSSMPASCGETSTVASQRFIALNHRMHVQMAVNYTCDHTVDFVRQMMPHHAAAIDMCAILLEDEETDDPYLTALCHSIISVQKREIAWMYQWLTHRNLAITAPCPSCVGDDHGMDMNGNHTMEDNDMEIEPPCEDLVSFSSFCHGRLKFCTCQDVINYFPGTCDTEFGIVGYGWFDPAKLCARTCGTCPSENSTIWVSECPTLHMEHHGVSMRDAESSSKTATSAANTSTVLWSLFVLSSLTIILASSAFL